MTPSLTIALVFAASLALVFGHAVRVGVAAYRQRRRTAQGEPGASPQTTRELKPIPGGAMGAVLPGGCTAQKVMTEAKPASTVKTS